MTRGPKVLVVDALGISPFYDQYFCSALADRGFDIDLSIREPDFLPGYFDNRKFQILKLARLSKLLFSGNSAAAKLLKYLELLTLDYPRIVAIALRSSVVHVQWLCPPPVASVELLYWKIVQLFGTKVIFTAHNIFPTGQAHTATHDLKRRYAFFDRIIVTSDYGKRLMEQHFPDSSSKVAKVPHGPLFHDVERIPADQARAQLNLPLSRPIVLFQGFLSPHKGIEFLLNAFPLVVREHQEALLLVVGGGDPAYRDKISGLLQQHTIPSHNIVTRLEIIPLRELVLLFNAADVVVLPYSDIYQSGALFTALAFAKAVVATRVGGLPEIIQDNVNGRLVDFGDEDALAKTVNDLLASHALRGKLGNEAYAMVTRRFGWEKAAERWEEVYRDVVKDT